MVAGSLRERRCIADHQRLLGSGLPTGDRIEAVAGVGLPMPLRVVNHAHPGLEELAEKAVTGGREGVYAGSEA